MGKPRFSLVALIALTACASNADTRAHGNTALTRFDELCKFLPAGMQSYWLSDWSSESPTTVDESEHRKIARAAKDFQSPPGIPGTGTETSVVVYDYGQGPHAHPATEIGEDWIQDAKIGEELVWRTQERPDQQTFWIAFVDGRYQVNATSRQLLTEALTRQETAQSILAFVPDLSVLASHTAEIIICRPRPQPTTPFGGPSPTSLMMLQVHAGQQRIEFFTTGAQPGIRDYYGQDRGIRIRDREGRSGYQVFDMTFPKPDSWHLHLIMLYGQHLAI